MSPLERPSKALRQPAVRLRFAQGRVGLSTNGRTRHCDIENHYPGRVRRHITRGWLGVRCLPLESQHEWPDKALRLKFAEACDDLDRTLLWHFVSARMAGQGIATAVFCPLPRPVVGLSTNGRTRHCDRSGRRREASRSRASQHEWPDKALRLTNDAT